MVLAGHPRQLPIHLEHPMLMVTGEPLAVSLAAGFETSDAGRLKNQTHHQFTELASCNKYEANQKANQAEADVSYQKEEIVELDEIRHRVGVQVVEGGYLEHGFSFYKTTTQLGSGVEKGETVVDVEVTYEHGREIDETAAVAFTLQFLKSLEAYLLSDSA
ncbi:Phytohormone-binding protein CSBP [Linum grandiflorum]